MGVPGHNAAQQGPAASSSLHTVLGGDVVLDNEGDTVERTTDLALGTLLIQLLRNGEGIRVELQEGTGDIVSLVTKNTEDTFANSLQIRLGLENAFKIALQ